MCEADEFVVRIFVGAFCPDRFILFELNGYGGFRDSGFLPGAGAKVHFDAVRCFIEEGDVRELLEVEVGAEFAIDARKQVEIEGGGHTDWIIVGGDQCFFGLEHVDAEQKRVPGLKNLTQIAKKVRAGGAIEVADGTAEEKHEKMLGGSAAGGNFAEPVEIFALEANDADAVDVAKFTAKNGERGRRDFDWVVPRGLPAGKGFEEQPRFSAGAAAEFGNNDRARKLVHDFPGVQLKQAFFGSREAVFRKSANYLKERGADRIIEIF